MTHLQPPACASTETARALAKLCEAQDEHDATHRTLRSGVTAETLAADNRRWEAVGAAIHGLARLICDQLAASAAADARPDVAALTARLSEAVDDLIDVPAWAVIDAAARLTALEPH